MTSKDSHDPGWNDPPIFTYEKAKAIQKSAANKKRLSLNKRVVFPIEGKKMEQSDSLSGTHSLKMPPPCSLPQAPRLSFPVEANSNTLEKSKTTVVEKERLDEALKNLRIDESCKSEVIKRIKIMEKMWVEDKLDNDVRLKTVELIEALVKGDAVTADHIQRGLMVDKVSQCSSWMSGIRQLISQRMIEKS